MQMSTETFSSRVVHFVDLIDGHLEVDEEIFMRAFNEADHQSQMVTVNCLDELEDGETLQQHVTRNASSGTLSGPYEEDTLILASRAFLDTVHLKDLAAARVGMGRYWKGSAFGHWQADLNSRNTTVTPLQQLQEWESHIKNLQAGDYNAYRVDSIGRSASLAPLPLSIVNLSVIVCCREGSTIDPTITSGVHRFWLFVRQPVPLGPEYLQDWAIRNIQKTRSTTIAISVVEKKTGQIISQNHASFHMLGNYYGSCQRISAACGEDRREKDSFSERDSKSFLDMLFEGNDDEYDRLKSTVSNGMFLTRIQIHCPLLLRLMRVPEGGEAHQDLKIMITPHALTNDSVFIITHIDVTDTVLAQKAAQRAYEELKEEKDRMQLLIQRQYELLQVLKDLKPNGSKSFHSSDQKTLLGGLSDQIAIIQEALNSESQLNPADAQEIKFVKVLGRGGFATVYLGEWRGALVAVKRIVLPAAMSNSERARAMAVTEIAISSSMSHPNLVQTFTYSIRALGTEGDAISCSGPDLEDLSDSEVSLPTISSQLSGASSSRKSPSFIHAHEMRLVLEYCDKGSLSDYVKSRGGIRDPKGQLDYSAVLETAADVARAMIHLHLNNICHSDLKAGNVMLKSEAVDGRGVRAKVVDFGLSINLTSTATHVSNIFQGTTSHMAPEVLMEGKQSKAADVYAFGMVLWELVSGGHPFQGIPQIALAQLTVFQHMRPTLPDDVPEDLKLLIERCWQPKVSARPRFEEILDELQAMKEKVEEESKAMYVPGVFLRNSSITECSQDSNDGTKKSKIFGDRAKLTQARFSPKVQQREAATYDSSTDILSDKEESSMHLDKHVGGLILVLNDQSTAGL